ncbi:putative hydrogenase 2 b cytochrome subunit [Salmonella enterica subsp. enterica serovar Heidelberg]|nr:putative hydrogenase 2 b cytochrome subunit [Salmonella enterica subsp. enterica serovar Heidelberg]
MIQNRWAEKIISKPVIIFGPLIVLCMLLIVKRLVFGLGSVFRPERRFPVGRLDCL